jgi:hypothetical protein
VAGRVTVYSGGIWCPDFFYVSVKRKGLKIHSALEDYLDHIAFFIKMAYDFA